MNGKALFGISGEEDNLAKYAEIFENSSPGISVLFRIVPRIFVWGQWNTSKII